MSTDCKILKVFGTKFVSFAAIFVQKSDRDDYVKYIHQ